MQAVPDDQAEDPTSWLGTLVHQKSWIQLSHLCFPSQSAVFTVETLQKTYCGPPLDMSV